MSATEIRSWDEVYAPVPRREWHRPWAKPPPDLRPVDPPKPPRAAVSRARRMLRDVATIHGLAASDLIGRSREQPIVDARHEAIRLIRRRTDLSLKEIGRLFGNRDHTTIHHAVMKPLVDDLGLSAEQLIVERERWTREAQEAAAAYADDPTPARWRAYMTAREYDLLAERFVWNALTHIKPPAQTRLGV